MKCSWCSSELIDHQCKNIKCPKNIFSAPELAHFMEFLGEIDIIREKKIDGIKRYGAKDWDSLGTMGLFGDINRKYIRLKRFFWEDIRQTTSENIFDTCYDLAVISIHLAMAYKKEIDAE